MLRIVYATDMGYLMPTKVSASSALAWASERSEIAIYVLDCGVEDSAWENFSRDLRKMFGESFELHRRVVDMSRFASLRGWTNNSKAAYARLDIPNLLPDVSWCLYADGDTLFVEDPLKLTGIWRGDCAIMGHIDAFDDRQRTWHQERNLPWHDETHICSGFILMNLDWFRAHDATNKCIELLRRYPDFPCVDQDALNIVCENNIKLLPDEWGVFIGAVEHGFAKGCWHYVAERPWRKWKRFGIGSRVLISSTQKIWIKLACFALGVKPWEIFHCSRVEYFEACFLSALSIFAYRVLNRLPVAGLRHRYDSCLRKYWSRKEVKTFFDCLCLSCKNV